MALPALPRAQAPLTLGGDRPSNEYRRWFEKLASAESVESGQLELDVVKARVTVLEDADYIAGNTTITGNLSVRVLGSLNDGSVSLQLIGDVTNPDPASYYGTSDAGAKGWHALTLDALQDVDLTVPPTDGQVLSYDLATETWIPETVSGSGIVQSVVAGTGITVDSTDPANPIVNATGGGGGSGVWGAITGDINAQTDLLAVRSTQAFLTAPFL